jgi:hypothetical protein
VNQALLVAGLLLGLGALAYFLRRQITRIDLAKKAVQRTVDELGCTREEEHFVGEFEGERFELLAQFDKRPASVRLSVPEAGPRITVTRNGALLRFWTRIGFSRPIDSGDDRFNDNFYVDSAKREFATTLLRHRAIRTSLERLASVEHREIVLGGASLIVRLPSRVLAAPDGATHLRGVLTEARCLAEEVRKAREGSAAKGPRGWPLSVIAILLAPLLGAAGGCVFIRTMPELQLDDAMSALKLCGWISLGVYVGLLAVVVLACAGRSDAHRLLFLWALSGLLAVPMTVFGLAFGGNALLDRSQARQTEVRIRELKYDDQASDRKGVWHLFVYSWRGERKVDLVHPTKDEADALLDATATHAVLELRDGAFGWERILKIEPAPDR